MHCVPRHFQLRTKPSLSRHYRIEGCGFLLPMPFFSHDSAGSGARSRSTEPAPRRATVFIQVLTRNVKEMARKAGRLCERDNDGTRGDGFVFPRTVGETPRRGPADQATTSQKTRGMRNLERRAEGTEPCSALLSNGGVKYGKRKPCSALIKANVCQHSYLHSPRRVRTATRR
jgi:hypothetical protein